MEWVYPWLFRWRGYRFSNLRFDSSRNIIMAKYRIIKENGLFYPQEKANVFSPWLFLDNWIAESTWVFDQGEAICDSMEEAMEVIEKRINFKKKPKKPKRVIIKYPLTINNEGGEQ